MNFLFATTSHRLKSGLRRDYVLKNLISQVTMATRERKQFLFNLLFFLFLRSRFVNQPRTARARETSLLSKQIKFT